MTTLQLDFVPTGFPPLSDDSDDSDLDPSLEHPSDSDDISAAEGGGGRTRGGWVGGERTGEERVR